MVITTPCLGVIEGSNPSQFVDSLSQIVHLLSITMNSNSAVQSILDSYDLEQLKDIAEHGCVSGCAREHIYYTETSAFFDKFEDEIEEYMLDNFGDDFMITSAQGCQSITDMKNKIVWTFIELVAQENAYAEVA